MIAVLRDQGLSAYRLCYKSFVNTPFPGRLFVCASKAASSDIDERRTDHRQGLFPRAAWCLSWRSFGPVPKATGVLALCLRQKHTQTADSDMKQCVKSSVKHAARAPGDGEND